jgi:hypothetical protein
MDSHNLGRRCKSLQEYPLISVNKQQQQQQQQQPQHDNQEVSYSQSTQERTNDSQDVGCNNLNSIRDDATLHLLRQYALEQSRLLQQQVGNTVPQSNIMDKKTRPSEQLMTITEKDGKMIVDFLYFFRLFVYE